MLPTVGRIVHYVAFGTPNHEYEQGAHRAAIITDVHSNVSLAVFNPTGIHFRDAVVQDEETKAVGTWHWPERDGDMRMFDEQTTSRR